MGEPNTTFTSEARASDVAPPLLEEQPIFPLFQMHSISPQGSKVFYIHRNHSKYKLVRGVLV